MLKISDIDYRSHSLPCYPFEGQLLAKLIDELEAYVVMEISDKDYRSICWPCDALEEICDDKPEN